MTYEYQIVEVHAGKRGVRVTFMSTFNRTRAVRPYAYGSDEYLDLLRVLGVEAEFDALSQLEKSNINHLMEWCARRLRGKTLRAEGERLTPVLWVGDPTPEARYVDHLGDERLLDAYGETEIP